MRPQITKYEIFMVCLFLQVFLNHVQLYTAHYTTQYIANYTAQYIAHYTAHYIAHYTEHNTAHNTAHYAHTGSIQWW